MAYVKIIKGDTFLCKKNFKMDDGILEFIKSKTYISEVNDCITDEGRDIKHIMGGVSCGLSLNEFNKYFKQLE